MKKFEGLNYREAQKRNTQHFKNKTKAEQKELKEQGYHNVSWDKVKTSWALLKEGISDNIITFPAKVNSTEEEVESNTKTFANNSSKIVKLDPMKIAGDKYSNALKELVMYSYTGDQELIDNCAEAREKFRDEIRLKMCSGDQVLAEEYKAICEARKAKANKSVH